MSNITSHFGQGIALNGVDQQIDLLEDKELQGEFAVTITAMKLDDFPMSSEIDYKSRIAFKSSLTELRIHSVKYNFTYIKENIPTTATFNIKESVVQLYINGILDEEIERTEDNVFSIRYIGKSVSNYYNSDMENIILINQSLTPKQIKYQYEHPERFLYREGNVLKSQILTQSEIDEVKLYMPLCEQDGYVRDLVGYSEGEVNVDVTGSSVDSVTEGNTIISTGVTGQYDIVLTTQEGNTYKPRFFLENANYVSGDIYKLNLKIEVTSGVAFLNELRVYNGVIHPVYKELSIGVYEYSFITDIWDANISPMFNGNTHYNVEMQVTLSVKKLTGTYPIANYTDAVRTDAQRLDSGLQTCKWKRNTLGVPYAGSFDRLECDGVGYLDTGWIPSSGDWSIEFTYDRDVMSGKNDTFAGIGIETNNKADLYIRVSDTSSSLNIVVGESPSNVITLINKITLVTITFNEETKTVTSYANGVAIISVQVVWDYSENQGRSFFIGGVNRNNIEKMSIQPMMLFKVHDKAMLEQEVKARYDRAVKQGLLTV